MVSPAHMNFATYDRVGVYWPMVGLLHALAIKSIFRVVRWSTFFFPVRWRVVGDYLGGDWLEGSPATALIMAPSRPDSSVLSSLVARETPIPVRRPAQ